MAFLLVDKAQKTMFHISNQIFRQKLVVHQFV